jgi:hypothetical protein
MKPAMKFTTLVIARDLCYQAPCLSMNRVRLRNEDETEARNASHRGGEAGRTAAGQE